MEDATDEGEGDDVFGGAEWVESEEVEGALVDQFCGETEERHGDERRIIVRDFEGFASCST